MKFILLSLALVGCGRVEATGGTVHRVEGEARIVVTVDVSVCDKVPEQERVDCVSDVLAILQKLEGKTDGPESQFPGFSGQGT